jgi:hypothetical protein
LIVKKLSVPLATIRVYIGIICKRKEISGGKVVHLSENEEEKKEANTEG